MEEPSNEDVFDQFFDAPDEFSFSDCIKDVESELVESVGSSIISEVEFKEGEANESVRKKPNTLKPSFPDGLRRRSSSFELGKKIGSSFAEDLNSRSPVVSEIVEVSEEKIIPSVKKNNNKEKKKKKAREVSDSSKISSDKTVKDNGESKRNQENLVVTSENENSSLINLNESSSSSMLVFMAELVIKVRLEILSASGRVTDSSRHTSMLRYKSQLITYLETFLKSASLLAGYSSEEQILKLKMRGFTEGYDPTSCIRVILEQRAEYRPGAGVPEIYGASLVLESELPIHKRIIWHWKKTIFIWISMVLFLMQFLMILVCCRPIIIPRIRPRGGSANSNDCRNNRAQTRVS